MDSIYVAFKNLFSKEPHNVSARSHIYAHSHSDDREFS